MSDEPGPPSPTGALTSLGPASEAGGPPPDAPESVPPSGVLPPEPAAPPLPPDPATVPLPPAPELPAPPLVDPVAPLEPVDDVLDAAELLDVPAPPAPVAEADEVVDELLATLPPLPAPVGFELSGASEQPRQRAALSHQQQWRCMISDPSGWAPSSQWPATGVSRRKKRRLSRNRNGRVLRRTVRRRPIRSKCLLLL